MTASDGDQAEVLLAALRDRGYRVTRQRQIICRTVLELPGHPTAAQVHAAVRRVAPRVSLATVYTTLAALVESGGIVDLGAAAGGASHFDANPHPHANFVCTRCGRIEDLFDAPVDGLLDAARRRGHSVRGVRAVLYGACADCESRLTTGVSRN